MKSVILSLIDNGDLSWMDVVDKMESKYNIKRIKTNKVLERLMKRGTITITPRYLKCDTRI